ncbi:MAG: VCBS repeat-containing protein [Pseudomonadota bacterium]
MTRCLLFALGSFCLLGSACTEFPSIPDEGCGNHVIDGSEDCDGFPRNGGTNCLPPGSAFECHFDCSVNDSGPPRLCPRGWGCDEDSVCREPSGQFVESSQSSDVGAWALSAGDFDGDGRQDVMSSEPLDATGATRLRFNYFDQQGVLSETRLFPKSVLSPTINQISQGDTTSDIAFTSGALGVMNGRPDRTWVPAVFSSYRRPNASVRIVGIYDRAIQMADPFATLITFQTGTGFYVGDRATGTLVEHVAVPGSIAELAGDLVSGNVFEDSKHSPCLEPVFAMRGATYFSIVDVCDSEENGELIWRPAFDLSQIALHPPAHIDVAPQILDLNGDGHLDVLVGAGGRPYVAFGDGSALASATPYTYPGDNSVFPKATPLAVQDFTGDGVPDFVFPDRLVVSASAYVGATPSYAPIGNRLTTPWTVAKIADFNGNGLLDVVTASSGSLNLNFFNGTGTENLSASLVSTSAPVQLLSAGDFDGDLITDLALFEVPLPGQTTSTLKVAFGNAFAALGSPIAVGQIEQVEALNNYPGAGRDNLTVCSSETIDDIQNGALTLLIGGADRVPFAPLALTEFASNGSVENAGAFAVVSGHFIKAGQTDLLALAFFPHDTGPPPPIDVWSVPDITKPGRTPIRLSSRFDPRLTPVEFTLDYANYSADVASTSADLDGDQRDEAIFAMPADGGGHCGLLSIGADDQGSLSARAPVIIDEPCPDPQVLAVTFDPQRGPDLALLTGRTNADDRHLYVLWNDGSGQFSAQNSVQVSAPDDSPQAFTFLPLADGTGGFAYVTKDSLRLVRAPNLRQFAAAEALPADVTLSNGTGIVAADVNGDRLSDLVVSESGTLRVLRAQLKVP